MSRSNIWGQPDEAANKRLEQIRHDAARALAAKPGDIGSAILGISPGYWGDLNTYEPAAAAKLSIPMLILQGGRDYQVTLPDLQRLLRST